MRKIHNAFTLLFGIAVWLFYAVFYRHHLHYQEEIQLFLMTNAFFIEMISFPGGLADYVSCFFTQFFIDSFAGAGCIVLLLILLQRLVWHTAGHFSKNTDYYLLSFLPSLAYACCLLDENFLLTALAALIISLSIFVSYLSIHSGLIRRVYALLMIPIIYWLAGSVCFVFGGMCLMTEWRENISKKRLLTFFGVFVGMVCLLSVIAKYGMRLQYPLIRLALAGNYYRYPGIIPGLLPVIFSVTLFLPFLIKLLPKANSRRKRLFILSVQGLLLIGFAGGGLKGYADWEKEEIMAYDYFARMKKWNIIIRMADVKSPDTPLSVATLNLALAQKDYLSNYLFDYFQNGPQGLLPAFRKEFIAGVMTGEIYYHLGLINTSQRFAFEAMEAIPGYRKSVRCIQRLAETNLLNGQYEVARKYLYLLKQTFFYRKWAEKTSAYLNDEAQINTHPEWGELRRFRPQEDFLFSEQEKDMILGILYLQNNDNKMAYDYLLAYTLLNKDLSHFSDYYFMNRENVKDVEAPGYYQQALAFIWYQSGFRPEIRPKGISDDTVHFLNAFIHASQSSTDPEKTLYPQFGKTLWYYLLFRHS
ncbi:MAG: DUF6057 family protein [Dysgonamonadaceae bacterium]|jgi:hypothetical protein|nr:DUF6057 family protein [Dysgonamonadaceae bacterium]